MILVVHRISGPFNGNYVSILLFLLLLFQWLMLVTITILYNLVFVIGRGVFWELNNAMPTIWWILDYASDGIYVVDTLIHAHEGKTTLLIY